jgi:hypothetical protein
LYLVVSTWIIFNLTKQTYGVNDDVVIQNWLSGFYTGKPELMIRGSATPRISFGYIVSNLYSLFPNINWFSILLLSFTLVSWFLLGTLALKSKNLFVIITYIFISILHLTWFIPSPTYTATAVILSFSTLIFLCKLIIDKKLRMFDLLIVLIYVISFFIRPESFLLGTFVASPFLVYAIVQNFNYLKLKKKLVLASIVIIFSLFSVDIFSESMYYKNNPDWKDYKKWEQARYAIQANNPEKLLGENPVKYGWSMAEYEIFRNYNAVDSENFNNTKLEKLITDTKSTQKVEPLNFLKQSHQQIFDSDINWEWKKLIQLVTFMFLLFLFLSARNPARYLLLSLSALSILYLIMLYIAGLLRQPERVQVSVIFLAILISWISFIFTKTNKDSRKLNSRTILSGLLVVLIAGSALPQLQYLKIKVAGASNVFWQNQRIYLNKFPQDSIFVGNASQFRNNWISPYTIENYDVERRIFSFGWHNFSPHWTKRALSLGLNPKNVFESVINDPRVYWVSDPESMDYIVQYMKERKLDFKGPMIAGELEYVGNRYIVWNFDSNG